MSTPTHYHIKVKGQLDPHWSDWFDGLTIRYEADGNTVLFRTDGGSSRLVWYIA
ncbi:MAG TPA: hypothetical protein VEC93_23525 [Anaerolineae bacterium]|nr:hypothetical protein [Anaerolineae bacterium]